MYLGELNAEQKEKFLDLGITLAMSDEDFSDEEKSAIRLLCDEMRIENRYEVKTSQDEAIAYFAGAEKRVRRIVILELLGIAMADRVFAASEKEMIDKMAKEFVIGEDEMNGIKDTIRELFAIYTRISSFLDR